jgi:hypothetical protein
VDPEYNKIMVRKRKEFLIINSLLADHFSVWACQSGGSIVTLLAYTFKAYFLYTFQYREQQAKKRYKKY